MVKVRVGHGLVQSLGVVIKVENGNGNVNGRKEKIETERENGIVREIRNGRGIGKKEKSGTESEGGQDRGVKVGHDLKMTKRNEKNIDAEVTVMSDRGVEVEVGTEFGIERSINIMRKTEVDGVVEVKTSTGRSASPEIKL